MARPYVRRWKRWVRSGVGESQLLNRVAGSSRAPVRRLLLTIATASITVRSRIHAKGSGTGAGAKVMVPNAEPTSAVRLPVVVTMSSSGRGKLMASKFATVMDPLVSVKEFENWRQMMLINGSC